MLLEKLKQQKSQENSSGGHYLQDRRLSEKLFPAVSYEPQLFTGHSSPNKRASIDCPAGHQYLPDLWKQPKTTAGGVHLNSGHPPSNRPRSYSQGRAVQHSINLADLKSQQHPPFRELPQLPKFKGGSNKPDKMSAAVDMVPRVDSVGTHDEIPKICYHGRLDHTTMMIAPQYSTSTDEGIETDLEDVVASSSPTLQSSQQRLTYPASGGMGPVIKSHSQNLAELLPCTAINQQYESDLQLSSLPPCSANEMAYTDCMVVSAAAVNSCPPPSSSSWDRRASFLNSGGSGDGRPRLENMSPISFREGRRASDGLMNQIDSMVAPPPPPSSPRSPQQYNSRVAFNGQKLQDCGKAKGLAELHMVQKEHETLKMLYQSCLPNDEQLRKQSIMIAAAAAAAASEPNVGGRNSGGEYHRNKDVPPRSPSAGLAKRFNYTDGYALDKSGLQHQLLQQRLLQHKRTVLQKQGAAFSQCSVTAAIAADAQVKRQHHHAHRQPLYNKAAQLSPQHSGDGHVQLQSADGSWQSLPHTMATCQINDFDSQANWLSVPDPQHHWYCTSGQPYSFSKNYLQVSRRCVFDFIER